ncbi:MAG: hypothetical protein JJU36_15970 [Phycisphaeraceae bacterium]|nr:hypothetical protein [Phycisphaeraceae bacterium]
MNMKTRTELTVAGRDYATAYAAHYAAHDLPTALKLYLEVIASHPGTRDAFNARSQARNIIRATVPEKELMDAHVALAFTHFEQKRNSNPA